MHLEKRIPKNRFRVDFVAYDKAGKPILFGETKSMEASPEAIGQISEYLDASKSKIPFAILADPELMRVYRKDEGPAQLVWTFRSSDVLAHYDPEIVKRRIFARYLGALIEGWLRDLAYHWKSVTPPARDEMAEIGLLALLEGGTTKSEVWLAGNPLS